MTRITADDARDRLDDLLDQAADSHEPLHIQGRDNAGVLLSEADWRSIEATLHLLTVPGMRESLLEGRATPIADCDEEPGW
jgi:prevent-host-death family protein